MSLTREPRFLPLLPTYSEVRHLLSIFATMPKEAVTGYINAMEALRGTPQNPVDWTEPDRWIDERLEGEYRNFAWRVWRESNHEVNPRHLRGSYYFINRHGLIDVDDNGFYVLSDISRGFLNKGPEVIRRLDESEGLRQLLGILATKTTAKRGDLLPEWAEFVRGRSNYQKDRPIQGLLRNRLVNLLDRGLVTRDGQVYALTEAGLDYALPVNPVKPDLLAGDALQEVTRSIRDYNEKQVTDLRERIGRMAPYAFEHLIRDLLEAMGYEDVMVTKESGDRGVDVVATVQFGITEIREVVQVKRHQGSITRPTIDQLRGALPYHDAIRGTIITTGRFSKGCAEAALFQNAAPITLIDGDKLMGLLVEHSIGIQKQNTTLYQVDTEVFAESSEEEQIEQASFPETSDSHPGIQDPCLARRAEDGQAS